MESISLNPTIWGPDQWTVLYETCYAFEKCRHFRSAKGMMLLKRFLYILANLFLCDHCGEFFNKQLVLSTENTNMIDWIYDLKNLVTLKIFASDRSIKKCTLVACPNITLSRLEFYNRLLFQHNEPQLDPWFKTINLIRTYHGKSKMQEVDDLNETILEMTMTIPYFKKLHTVLSNSADPTFFDNYLKAATIL